MENYKPFFHKRKKISNIPKILLQIAITAILAGTIAVPLSYYIASERDREKMLKSYNRLENYIVCKGDSYSKIAYNSFPQEIRNKIDSMDRTLFLEELNGVMDKSKTIYPGDRIKVPVYSTDTAKN